MDFQGKISRGRGPQRDCSLMQFVDHYWSFAFCLFSMLLLKFPSHPLEFQIILLNFLSRCELLFLGSWAHPIFGGSGCFSQCHSFRCAFFVGTDFREHSSNHWFADLIG